MNVLNPTGNDVITISFRRVCPVHMQGNGRFWTRLYLESWHSSPPGSLISDIRDVSGPKYSKVDQSTPGFGPKCREALQTFGTVGPLDIRIWHTCTTVDVSVHVKTAFRKKVGVVTQVSPHTYSRSLVRRVNQVRTRNLAFRHDCFYRHFRLHGVSRPKFSSGPKYSGCRTKVQGPLETFGTVGPLDIRMWHSCTTFDVSVWKRLSAKKWAWHRSCIYFRIKVRFFLGDPFT